VLTWPLRQVSEDICPRCAKIFFVSITVDPERDTAEVLQQYAQSFGANFAGWLDVARAVGRTSVRTDGERGVPSSSASFLTTASLQVGCVVFATPRTF
jgi:hypothetical protein